MTSTTAPLGFEETGNAALDKILGGGIPSRSLIVVAGEPGSGKTVFTLQCLFHAARAGKKCLYLTTISEPALKVIRFMQGFEFFDEKLLQESVVFADLGAAVREGVDRVLERIEALVHKHKPSYVAIDSFRVIADRFANKDASRAFVYELSTKFPIWGVTALLVGEYVRNEYPAFAEFAVADGIIHLGSERQELTSIRAIEVLKLRGASYRSGQHFFDITRDGVSFFPRVSSPGPEDAAAEFDDMARVETGTGGLDEMLYGGLPRGTTTVLQGGTGTGKTLLSLKFLLEGARTGEKGVYFTLEETPRQLRRICRALGWDLDALVAQGLLVIHYTSPVELSTDLFLYRAREVVQGLGATRAVFDSVSTLSLGVPSQRRFKEMVYAIAKHMNNLGVTLLMTMETEQMLGTTLLSGHGVSFLADNVIQLRYIEIDGRLERGISILKARGIKHHTEVRSLTIEQGGPQVTAGRFTDLQGVLTGLTTRTRR